MPNCRTCSRLSIFYTVFLNRTAVHVPDFQFFIIRAVDIFQCFCRAVAIRAVVHFGLKLASTQNDVFFDFWAVFIFLTSARTVSSSRDFGVEQFFWADEFRAVDPSPNVWRKRKKKEIQIQFFVRYKVLWIFFSLFFFLFRNKIYLLFDFSSTKHTHTPSYRQVGWTHKE